MPDSPQSDGSLTDGCLPARWFGPLKQQGGKLIIRESGEFPIQRQEEVLMKRLMLGLAAAGFFAAGISVNSFSAQQTDPQPTCRMCEGTYLPAAEIQEYWKKAMAEGRVDQQARDVDIGKAHIGIGVVHRTKLDAPGAESVAEHDLVSEVYYIVSGSGTLVLGPDITNLKRRGADV